MWIPVVTTLIPVCSLIMYNYISTSSCTCNTTFKSCPMTVQHTRGLYRMVFVQWLHLTGTNPEKSTLSAFITNSKQKGSTFWISLLNTWSLAVLYMHKCYHVHLSCSWVMLMVQASTTIPKSHMSFMVVWISHGHHITLSCLCWALLWTNNTSTNLWKTFTNSPQMPHCHNLCNISPMKLPASSGLSHW